MVNKLLLKFKETIKTRYIYQSELHKACFQLDMTYGDFKYLNRRTIVDKVFNIATNPKYDGYQRGLASMVYKLFDKLLVEQLKMKLYLIKN